MRAVNEETYNENNKLVRLSDVMNIIENQCSDGHMWGDDNITLIDASETIDALSDIPAVDAEPVVRCKDCRWWVHEDDSKFGYCNACKHGYFSKHWEISIYRKYKADWYCAYGEKVTE